jgi:hypothetical protein
MASVSSSPMLAAAVLVLLLFSSAGAGEAAAAPALDEVCGRLGGYYVTPALCTSALCADPSAASAINKIYYIVPSKFCYAKE